MTANSLASTNKNSKSYIAFACLLTIPFLILLSAAGGDLLRAMGIWTLMIILTGVVINVDAEAPILRSLLKTLWPTLFFFIGCEFLSVASFFFDAIKTIPSQISASNSNWLNQTIYYFIISILTWVAITASAYARGPLIEAIIGLTNTPTAKIKKLEKNLRLIIGILAFVGSVILGFYKK